MKLLKVVIRNFLSYREATVFLEDRGLVSIQGITNDADGADSNGSGKSSLINAILWCNYDDPGKKLGSVDEVVNTAVGKDCMVQCWWYEESTDTTYIITRYRKHPKFKNSVTVELVTLTSHKDISKGTNPATQELIKEILGCDQKTFEASCFARQDDAPDIPGMTDGELKSLLEKTLPFEDLGGLYKTASKNVTDHMQATLSIERNVERLALRLEQTRQDIDHVRKDIDGWDEHIEDKRYKIANDMESYKEEAVTLEATLKPMPKIIEAIDKYQALVDTYDDGPRQRYIVERSQIDKKVNAAWRGVQEVSSKCNTCNRPYDNHEQALIAASNALTDARAERTVIEAGEKGLLQAHSVYGVHANKLEQLKLLKRTQERQVEHIARAKENVERLQAEYTAKYPNPYNGTLDRLKTRHDELILEGAKATVELDEARKRLEVLEAAAFVVSPKGVRYHILEEVTPKLTGQTNYYLSQLTDGKLKAVWSTVTKLKSGDYKEKFSISVTGGSSPSYGGLSGGEKRKVKLACFFALQDLIAERATKSISLWCGDEIDHALDPSGMERLMSLLHEKTKKKSTILVISHNELRAWIPNFTTVVKKDGISTITGYLSEQN